MHASRLAPLSMLFIALACNGDDPGADGETGESGTSETGGEQGRYSAQIRRTSHGVPHISADSWGSLGFGQGYAFTEDKGCLLADQLVKVHSERARYFGRGDQSANLNSDFAYLHLGLRETAEEQFALLEPELVEIIEGYAAGYTQALADGKIGGDCDGQDWVRTEVTGVDLMTYYLDLGLLASSRQVMGAIGAAQPPGGNAPFVPAPHYSALAHRDRVGSNGWGFGAELTASGRGMVMGNPHFPWEGELQLWESHLTIPGEFEVYGASLLGVPGVLIGFNDAVAWTHTVSDGHRITMYEIDSPPGEPTQYMYDGEVREMQSQSYTIDVLAADGTMEQESRTLWRTHYGPMLSLEPFYWTDALALSYRDANIDNFVLLEQFLGMNGAASLDEFKQVHREVSGIPWVNTMAASADGRAWYMDNAATPNLTQAAIDAWLARKESGFTKAFFDQDIWLLDGSDSRDEWQEVAGARSPGLVAPADMPELERDDFVFNANDSHWLSNPLAPLEGYSPLHGFEQTARSVRTRQNAKVLLDVAAGGGFAGADGKLDLDELAALALDNEAYTGTLLQQEVAERCTGVDVWEADGQVVDIAEACDQLASWDGHLDLDSVGAVVWREFLGDFEAISFRKQGSLFATPFDLSAPLTTPTGLAEGDAILDAIANAVLRLDEAGIALDAALGEAQFTRKGSETIPIHGGNGREGVTNVVAYSNGNRSDLSEYVATAEELFEPTDLRADGYQINFGTSFIMCVEFTDDGPRGQALLSYSQSAEAESGWFSDQTERFSQKQWRPMLWEEADIVGDPNLVEYTVSGG